MVRILSVTKNIKRIETMASRRRVYLYHKLTLLPNFGRFWVVFEGWSQILTWTNLFPMDLNQVVLPSWLRRRSWRKRYSNTMTRQIQAKLAAGALRGHESRKHPARGGVRGRHRSWPFMYIGVRDPPFFDPTGPLFNGSSGTFFFFFVCYYYDV